MFSIWIPQIAAFLAALLVAWLAKHNMNIDVEVVTATFVGIFTIVKTVLSRWLNPANVAAPELVDEGVQRRATIRRARGL